MRAKNLFLISLLLIPAFSPILFKSVAQTVNPKVSASKLKWHVPTYQGLVLGKSRRASLVRKFGKPVWMGHPEDEYDNPVKSLIKYNFENVGGFKGETWVVMNRRTGVIIDVALYPSEDNRISRQQIVERYGSDFIERDDRLGPCPAAKELRTYKQPEKIEPLMFLVYPRKGMYVTIDYDHTAREIVYLMKCP